MCFGEQETGKKDSNSQTSETYTANPATQSAATQNLGFAQNLQNQGFTPYQGQQVASFSPMQSQSFNMANALGSNGYADQAKGYIDQYGNAPASQVSANTIASGMNPYMNQYVMDSLQPQLQAQNIQFAGQNKNLDAAATSANAFGDSRAGIEAANLTNNQNIARTGLIGNAYNSAFNTAIGASAQDQANNLGAQTTNAGLNEQALSRALGANTALQGLGGYQGSIANLTNQYGQQQTAQDQAGLTAQYNQWLMGQQYPFQTSQLLNQTVGASGNALGGTKTGSGTSSTTTLAPDNSGWALAGNVASAAMMAADGGAIPAGQPTVVGERGPEVIVPGTNSVVVPNEVMQAAKEKRAKKLKRNGPDNLGRALGVAA